MELFMDIHESVNDITASEFVESATIIHMDNFQMIYDQKSLHRVRGIYCFLDEYGNPLYLGKTIDLHGRIKNHLGNCHSPVIYLKGVVKFVGFIAVKASDIELSDLEHRLICKVKPLFNGGPQSTWINYKYKNLRQWLNEIPSEDKQDAKILKTCIEEKISRIDEEKIDKPMPFEIEGIEYITSINFDALEQSPVNTQFKHRSKEMRGGQTPSAYKLKKVEVVKYLLDNIPESRELDYVLATLVGE